MNEIKSIPNEIYHSPACPGLSASGIKEFLKSPAHYRSMIFNPQPATPAMAFGSAVHCAILEPERFTAEYCVAPVCDKRTIEGKAIYKEFAATSGGKEIISTDDMTAITAIHESVSRRETVRGMLSGCVFEQSVLWTHDEYGFPCKARPDALNISEGYIVDIKTSSKPVSPASFSKTIANNGYDVQAAWYLNGAAIVTGKQFNEFYFVAIESSSPHEVGIYKADYQMIINGLRKIRRMIPEYAECLKTGLWPGYPDEIQNINLPAWAQTE